jgi:hypothetical protein
MCDYISDIPWIYLQSIKQGKGFKMYFNFSKENEIHVKMKHILITVYTNISYMESGNFNIC